VTDVVNHLLELVTGKEFTVSAEVFKLGLVARCVDRAHQVRSV
jgi:hypothetical protein